jgi:hypothetical protein
VSLLIRFLLRIAYKAVAVIATLVIPNTVARSSERP